MAEFGARLIDWHARHGRHDLPWQRPVTPYRAWISEIMLQQTQVQTVIPYFERFIARFPDVQSLAAAPQDEVLRLWSGLGYYARARNLHRAAQVIRDLHDGEVPEDLDALMALPGIGRSSAGSILALSRNRRLPILDGNVKRVLCRHEAIHGWPGRREVETQLWARATALVPETNPAAYTQAIMDLGATVCVRGRPRCGECPVSDTCEAKRLGLETVLPEPRPRKDVPVRRARLALIENAAGEILLERRPAAGIWGGLWSLPECPADDDAADWVRERFGWSVAGVETAPEFRHTFSHFHLDILPLRIRLSGEVSGVADAGEIAWRQPGAELDLGVAAPIRKLIEGHSLGANAGRDLSRRPPNRRHSGPAVAAPSHDHSGSRD